MWKLLNTTALVRSPADEGAGGEGNGGDKGGASGEGDGGDAGQGGDEGDKGKSSILDLASGDKGGKEGEGEGEGDGDYKPPDYLPEHLRGKDANDTMLKVHNAYKGARKSLSEGRGRLEGDVPEKPDGYTFEDTGSEEAPDKVYAELTSEASKPLVDLASKAAHKLGLPDKAFQSFMREFVSGAAEAGLPIGLNDGEAQEISAEAEMEALTELVGSGTEASTVVNTVENYGKNLVARGTIADADLAEFRMMVGTAESALLFHKILVAEMGEKPIPVTVGADATMSSTDAYAAHGAASAMPDGAEKDAAMASAQKAMQKAFGDNAAGSVKSNVL